MRDPLVARRRVLASRPRAFFERSSHTHFASAAASFVSRDASRETSASVRNRSVPGLKSRDASF
jgi:hypothetical protein